VYGIKEKDMFSSSLYPGILCHPNTPLTSNISVQNITSTSVTEKNLADLRVISDNKNKFIKSHTLSSLKQSKMQIKIWLYYKASFPFTIFMHSLDEVHIVTSSWHSTYSISETTRREPTINDARCGPHLPK
jgi:hypothetical protein